MNVKKLSSVIDGEAGLKKTERKDFVLEEILARVPCCWLECFNCSAAMRLKGLLRLLLLFTA
jgi:hypothetical protein